MADPKKKKQPVLGFAPQKVSSDSLNNFNQWMAQQAAAGNQDAIKVLSTKQGVEDFGNNAVGPVQSAAAGFGAAAFQGAVAADDAVTGVGNFVGGVARDAAIGVGLADQRNPNAPVDNQTYGEKLVNAYGGTGSPNVSTGTTPSTTAAGPGATPPQLTPQQQVQQVSTTGVGGFSASNPNNPVGSIAARGQNYDSFGNVSEAFIADRQGGTGAVQFQPGGRLSENYSRAIEGRGQGTFNVVDMSGARENAARVSQFLAENRQRLDQRAGDRRQRNLERMATKRVDLNESLSEYFTNVSNRRYARDVLKDKRANDAASTLQSQKDAASDQRESFKQLNENARNTQDNNTSLYKERMTGIRERLKSSAEALGGKDKNVSMARVEAIMTGAIPAYNRYAEANGLAPASANPAEWNNEVLSLMTALAENVFKSQVSGDKGDVDAVLNRMLGNRGV